jgi:type I restriction enzyme M protein
VIETVSLGELCQWADGISAGPSWSRLKSARTGVAGIPVVKPAALTTDGRILHEGLDHFPEREADALDRFRLRVGDIVTVRQGMLGRQAVVGADEHGWLFGPACIRIRLDRESGVLPEYLARYLGRADIRDWLYSQASGQTVSTLTERRLAAMPVLVPPLRVQKALCDQLAQVDEQTRRHELALDLLGELRASLIERAVRPPAGSG